jgi:SRSO17 transposase
MLGERPGEARPWGMHHLRARAAWHSHGVASELRGFVIDHLGVADAISVLDEI